MSRKEKTSPGVASKASKILRDSGASKAEKSVAGSALAQRDAGKATSSKVATTAAKTLDSPRTSKVSKTIAASVLTQKTKK